jgi:hypothetical protein
VNTGTIRIGGALIFGIAIIAGAVFFAPSHTPANALGLATATNTPERQYIPTTDSNGDGVSDWKDQFPKQVTVAPLASSSTSTPFTPPQTVTGEYALRFFQNAVSQASQGQLSDQQKQNIPVDTLKSLPDPVRKARYTENNITTSDNSLATLHDYGNKLASIVLRHATGKSAGGELAVLKNAVTTQNQEVLSQLDPIRITYRQQIDELLALPAPPLLATQHLQLINYAEAMYEDIGVFQKAFSDPLLTIAYVKKYTDSAQKLSDTAAQLSASLFANGVRYTADEPAGQLIRKLNLAGYE